MDFNEVFEHVLPADLYFRVGLGLERGVYQHFDFDKAATHKAMAQLLSHVQFSYQLKSLGTRMNFDLPIPIVDLSPFWDCKQSLKFKPCSGELRRGLEKAGDIWKANGHIQHLMALAYMGRGGLLGMSALGATCKGPKTRSMNRLMKARASNSSPILVHEMAHNIGFGHVPKREQCMQKKFLMAGGGITNGWSPCHRHQLKRMYDRANKEGGYCMDRPDPALNGGSSWEPWRRWGKCDQCKQRRVRYCVGDTKCPGWNEETPGELVETRVCLTKKCQKKYGDN